MPTANLGRTAQVVLLCTLLLACLPHMVLGQTPQAFKVGCVSSATGPLSDIWHESVQGYQLFVKQFNDKYGTTGMPIQGADTTMYFSLSLEVVDDASSADNHYTAIQDLINNKGADFIVNAQPAFAINESQVVNSLNRLNLHGITSNDEVFKRQLPTVFGVAPSSTLYTGELLKAYKGVKISKIGVVYRSDVPELRAACQAALDNINSELLVASATIAFNSSAADAVQAVATQLAASKAEVVIACTLRPEAAQLITLIDQMQRPFKNMFFTNGPTQASFLAALPPNISQLITSPAAWHPDLKLDDEFYGSAKEYATKFSGIYNADPTYIAAGASASGYLLLQALQTAFKKCNISATGGDPKQLLFSTNVLVCADNQNNGQQRLLDTIRQISLTTFYGDITFNKFNQNYGKDGLTVQSFQVIKDLKSVVVPLVILPLSSATHAAVIPQPNRYAPVCQPGTYRGPDDFLPCILCPQGQFQEFAQKTNCELCPKDSYTNVTASSTCARCPDNSETYQRGTTNVTECFCRAGYFSRSFRSGVACEPCPEHATCAGGVDPPRNQAGWYAEKEAPFKMYNCNPNWVCPGNFTCKDGYQGRMCNTCSKGYYMAFNRCLPCKGGSGSNLVTMVLMYVLFIVINLFISRHLEVFQVAMNFCQFLSIVNLFNVNWPQALDNIMNIAGILSFETDIIQPQCADPTWRWEQNLYIQLAMPVFVLALVLVWTGFTYMCFRIKLKMQGKTLDDFSGVSFSGSSTFGAGGLSSVGNKAGAASMSLRGSTAKKGGSMSGSSGSFAAAETSAWWLLLQGFVQIPNDPAEMKEVMLDRLSLPLMCLNILYVALLKYCLSAFNCYDFMGTRYIYFSANDMCYTPKHTRVMMAGTAGLLCYVLGLWMLFFHVMKHLRSTRGFGEKRPLLLFGWLYERYEAQYHWYEATQLFQKTVMVVVAVFLINDPILQTLVCLAVTIAGTLIDIRTNALADKTSHVLQSVCDAALCAVLILGLVFYNEATPDSTQKLAYAVSMAAVVGTLGVLGVAFFLEIGFNALLFVLRGRHKRVAKKWGHSIRGHSYMYHVFKPMFMFRWLSRAKPSDWAEWHKLCVFLQEYVHPTSETSYLSVKKVGVFWRFLLSNFPEMLDYLVSVDEEQREHFQQFIEVMYEHFFDTGAELRCQLNMVVSERYRAPIAQWLAAADETELEFMRGMIKNAYGKAGGKEAEAEMSKALSRGTSVANLSRAASVADGLDGLVKGGSGDSSTWGRQSQSNPGFDVEKDGPFGRASTLTDLEGGGALSAAGGSHDSYPAATMLVTPKALGTPKAGAAGGGKNFAAAHRRVSVASVPTTVGLSSYGSGPVPSHLLDGLDSQNGYGVGGGNSAPNSPMLPQPPSGSPFTDRAGSVTSNIRSILRADASNLGNGSPGSPTAPLSPTMPHGPYLPSRLSTAGGSTASVLFAQLGETATVPEDEVLSLPLDNPTPPAPAVAAGGPVPSEPLQPQPPSSAASERRSSRPPTATRVDSSPRPGSATAGTQPVGIEHQASLRALEQTVLEDGEALAASAGQAQQSQEGAEGGAQEASAGEGGAQERVAATGEAQRGEDEQAAYERSLAEMEAQLQNE